ncbi:MAG: hypothetical protein ACTSRA_21325, partial [Promethearchaeota archaeon]
SVKKSKEKKELVIAFFPIGYNNQYMLEICYDGVREDIEDFVKVCNEVLNPYLQTSFKGNLSVFQPVVKILESFREKYGFFGMEDNKLERTGKGKKDICEDDDDIVVLEIRDIPDE